MRSAIEDKLLEIEARESVKILYACESGSRAWGFPSKDSDYDVRFVYIREKDWYLSIEKKRDVIELPVDEILDINGWDIRKAYQLVQKTNPPIAEWADSPIVYLERLGFREELKRLIHIYFSSERLLQHYFHIAQGNFNSYLKGDLIKPKKYLYVLRAILAAKWVIAKDSIPPMEIQNLYPVIQDRDVLDLVESLVERKKGQNEMEKEPQDVRLIDYLSRELEILSNLLDTFDAEQQRGSEELDKSFLNLLDRAFD